MKPHTANAVDVGPSRLPPVVASPSSWLSRRRGVRALLNVTMSPACILTRLTYRTHARLTRFTALHGTTGSRGLGARAEPIETRVFGSELVLGRRSPAHGTRRRDRR